MPKKGKVEAAEESPKKAPKEIVAARLSKELIERLQAMIDAPGTEYTRRTMSQMIEFAVEEFVAKRGKK
jgi:predicted transcriptional regulator